MGFWNKIIGKKQTKPPATTDAPRSNGSLDLPPEFDGKTSYRDMFRNLPQERARAMCRALPIERLSLNRPGYPPTAREMGAAITQVFGVSIYMATKEVPSEYGDIVFPRLIGKIEEYNGPNLQLELCDLVRDFAIQLAAVGRDREATRVLRVLKESPFWRAWPQADICLFASLNNIACETNLRSDFKAALKAAEKIPASQVHQIGGDDAVKQLRQKMEASGSPHNDLQPGATKTNPKDGAVMIWVPAGEFLMGSCDNDRMVRDDEKPQHQVYVGGSCIYRTPVTVAQYQKFCLATGGRMRVTPDWGWKGDHPLVSAFPSEAEAYAEWAGVRLPTEAEWEKAARGTDGRIYPWGNAWDASKICRSQRKRGDSGGTCPVGSYPSGASPYGCLDMSGNVWEWCADGYAEDFYKNAPLRNPIGHKSGIRVLRGGGHYDTLANEVRAAARYNSGPTAGSDFGFRCVVSTDEEGN